MMLRPTTRSHAQIATGKRWAVTHGMGQANIIFSVRQSPEWL